MLSLLVTTHRRKLVCFSLIGLKSALLLLLLLKNLNKTHRTNLKNQISKMKWRYQLENVEFFSLIGTIYCLVCMNAWFLKYELNENWSENIYFYFCMCEKKIKSITMESLWWMWNWLLLLRSKGQIYNFYQLISYINAFGVKLTSIYGYTLCVLVFWIWYWVKQALQ